LVNLQAGYQFSKNLEAKLDVLNLFNRKVNDIEYWYESCLANDLNTAECDPLSDSREGILDKHVHSSEDRSYRFTVKYTF
jgi:outer membrane receptor protein involved in Fe transport